MGKIKINVLSNLLMFKRKYRLLKWEHDILKNHKMTLNKYRFDVITSMKVTENMLHYLKFKTKGINIAKQAEQKVDKELAGIQIVSAVHCYDYDLFILVFTFVILYELFLRLIQKKKNS
jgi:hypothetical protein